MFPVIDLTQQMLELTSVVALVSFLADIVEMIVPKYKDY
jgi:hypothetical protein